MPQVRGTELTVAVWATAAPSYMWGYPPWRLSYISWCLPWLSTWCRLELHETDFISPDKSQGGLVLTGRWCLCPGQRRSHQVGGRTGRSSANRLPRWTGTGRSEHQPRPGGRAGYTGMASEMGKSSEKEKGYAIKKRMVLHSWSPQRFISTYRHESLGDAGQNGRPQRVDQDLVFSDGQNQHGDGVLWSEVLQQRWETATAEEKQKSWLKHSIISFWFSVSGSCRLYLSGNGEETGWLSIKLSWGESCKK